MPNTVDKHVQYFSPKGLNAFLHMVMLATCTRACYTLFFLSEHMPSVTGGETLRV
jgi:hypothetical protein